MTTDLVNFSVSLGLHWQELTNNFLEGKKVTQFLQQTQKKPRGKWAIQAMHANGDMLKIAKSKKELTAYHWSDVFTDWSPTPKGILSVMFHPLLIVLVLSCMCVIGMYTMHC